MARNPQQSVLRLFAAYAALVAVVCVVRIGVHPAACAGFAAGHALAAWLLWRRAHGTPRPLNRRLLLLPYGLWLISWIVLGRLYVLTGAAPHDPAVAALDLALFGGPWHVELGRMLSGGGIPQLMQAAYLSYYGIVVGPPLLLALRGREADCERYTLALMATYLACFVVYLVYPVIGPRAVAEATETAREAAAGGLAGLAALARQAGDSQGTAFPSSHCAASLAAALAAGVQAAWPVRGALLVWALLIALATVHTGNHYTLDSVAGVLLALAIHAVLCRRPIP